ncbi:tryptophan-rich sensory protein [Patescibacteria group bacterium]|nr:tryptophan-rich sensory protein [Patescibacteria group bacterium]MBU1900855.1 tryptophan-rich sensory protein [Patescibacteria group bacterium]
MKKNLFLKISLSIAYVAMIFVNYLANALPIGGVTTGQASDAYPNLFTPAGVTFSIWGLIYLLLLVHVLYQFGLFQKKEKKKREKILNEVGRYFLFTSFANIAWIFAWHYGVIWLSVLIMLSLLFFLIKIADIINKKSLSLGENICIRLSFSIYFGWITVATIANISVFLVSIGWNGFGISDVIWTVLVLLVGAAIGIARTIKDKNIFYGSVFVWAYSGILFKHVSESGFNGQYKGIIITLIFCLVLFLGVIFGVGYKNKGRKYIKY